MLSAGTIIGTLILVKCALHLATANRYGIFRDELYYLACAEHLDWGYVDQPPLIALVTWLEVHILGTSLLALRFLPAVAGAALVWLTARMARDLGGDRFAQCLAAFAVIPVPVYLILQHWLTMNAFEPLLWTTILWLGMCLVRRSDPRYWLAIGLVIGVGLENKYSMLLAAAALPFGLLLTPQRRLMKSWWFVAGMATAVLLVLPNLLWLIHHHFPFLEFEQHSRMGGSRIERSPFAFLADQMLIMNPALSALWIGGLLWLLIARQARDYRFLGWAFVTIFVLLLAVKSKNYYLTPAYPVLFAAGAVLLERTTQDRYTWIRRAYISLIALVGLILAPLVMPILPVGDFLAYQKALGGFTPVRFENLPANALPQHFADEFGWEDMVRQTGKAFNTLSEETKKNTAIFANNYGEAAAIDFFGANYGLPKAISNHESYWLWGPRNYTGTSVIVLGSNGEGDREHFQTVQVIGRADNPYARSIEHFDILLCQGLASDLREFWVTIRNW